MTFIIRQKGLLRQPLYITKKVYCRHKEMSRPFKVPTSLQQIRLSDKII